jgi:hypothetical protein
MPNDAPPKNLPVLTFDGEPVSCLNCASAMTFAIADDDASCVYSMIVCRLDNNVKPNGFGCTKYTPHGG